METLGNQNQQKTSNKFYCKICDYYTMRKCNFDDHLLTAKHKKNENGNILESNGNENQQFSSNSKYTCQKCDKEFNNRSGLWKHNKKCANEEKMFGSDFNEKEIIMTLLQQNNQLQNQIIELCKDKSVNINNTNAHINSHNKTFNLNVFLNEHCKDAMNIMDFVDSVKLQLSDLESIGKLGFVEGISNIILKNLKALDIHKRPVHCSDSKREVMYIKDEDKWEKENENKQKLRKAIKKIANKNYVLIPQFKEVHPDCNKSSSPYSDQYNKLIIEAMGGSGNEDIDNENKIIRKIAKEVTINKN
jgi:CRISPR type III-B/RAMP module RAMP protein Cmr1